MTNNIKKTFINDLFSVITLKEINSKTASLGFWIDGGSWKENTETNGIAHFLEHMMFKGTTTYNCRELTKKLEKIGGYCNAYTSNESVAYYLTVAPTNLIIDGRNNLEIAIELLFDMILNSTFPEEEMEKERGVIIQEIRMYKDDLLSCCAENFGVISYNDDSYLHRNIIGPESNILKFTPQDLKKFMEDNYNKIYFVAVGNIDEEAVINYCKTLTPAIDKKFTYKPLNVIPAKYIDEFQEKIEVKEWAQQAQVIMGWKSVHRNHPKRFIAKLITSILSGGLSGILVKRIREDLGLVYSIYADNDALYEVGSFNIVFQTYNEKVNQVIEEVNKIMEDLININDEQMEIAKTSIINKIIQRGETSRNKCFVLGELALIDDNNLFLEEIIEEYNKITKDEIIEFIKEYLIKPADKISKILNED